MADQSLYLDQDIRNYIFIPLIFLMTSFGILRMYITKLLNSTEHPALKPINSDFPQPENAENRNIEDYLDHINLEDTKHTQMIAASQRIRMGSGMLPEESLKTRKAYLWKEDGGKLRRTVTVNPLEQMMSMNMGNMMKVSVVNQIYNVALFAGLGWIFSGFILGRVPLPLTEKFRSMVQQGLALQNLDVSFVSSMSWCIILIFGLQGVQRLLVDDDEMASESMKMMTGAHMMDPTKQQQQQKDFNKMFKNELENFEVLTYNSRLQHAEQELLHSWRT